MNKLKVFTGGRGEVQSQIEDWQRTFKNVSIINVSSNLNEHGYVMCYIIYQELVTL